MDPLAIRRRIDTDDVRPDAPLRRKAVGDDADDFDGGAGRHVERGGGGDGRHRGIGTVDGEQDLHGESPSSSASIHPSTLRMGQRPPRRMTPGPDTCRPRWDHGDMSATRTAAVEAGGSAHARASAEVAAELGVDPRRGLGAAAVSERRERSGPNELEEIERPSVWAMVWEAVTEPFVILLFVAGVL